MPTSLQFQRSSSAAETANTTISTYHHNHHKQVQKVTLTPLQEKTLLHDHNHLCWQSSTSVNITAYPRPSPPSQFLSQPPPSQFLPNHRCCSFFQDYRSLSFFQTTAVAVSGPPTSPFLLRLRFHHHLNHRSLHSVEISFIIIFMFIFHFSVVNL